MNYGQILWGLSTHWEITTVYLFVRSFPPLIEISQNIPLPVSTGAKKPLMLDERSQSILGYTPLNIQFLNFPLSELYEKGMV